MGEGVFSRRNMRCLGGLGMEGLIGMSEEVLWSELESVLDFTS